MNLPTTILAASEAASHGLDASSTATNTEGSSPFLSSQPRRPSLLS